ncbi:MAG: hypothetical protein RL513_105 [Pseudomonadota bacterium]|jgi:hypothetical protein
MTRAQKQKRGDLAKAIRRLMAATGLSDEACRVHLRNGTRPTNPLVAAAWDKAVGRGAA